MGQLMIVYRRVRPCHASVGARERRHEHPEIASAGHGQFCWAVGTYDRTVYFASIEGREDRSRSFHDLLYISGIEFTAYRCVLQDLKDHRSFRSQMVKSGGELNWKSLTPTSSPISIIELLRRDTGRSLGEGNHRPCSGYHQPSLSRMRLSPMRPGWTLVLWSGRRDSNPRPQPWQGCALPLSYTRIREICGPTPAMAFVCQNPFPNANNLRRAGSAFILKANFR